MDTNKLINVIVELKELGYTYKEIDLVLDLPVRSYKFMQWVRRNVQ